MKIAKETSLKDIIINTIDSDSSRHTIRSLYSDIAHSYLLKNSEEVASVISRLIDDRKINKIDYNFLDMIVRLINDTHISMDKFAVQISERGDFDNIVKSASWRLFDMLNRASDEVWYRIFIKHINKFLHASIQDTTIARLAECKITNIDPDIIKKCCKIIDKSLPDDVRIRYWFLKSIATKVLFLSKLSVEGEELLKKAFFLELERTSGTKNQYDFNQGRLGIMRIVKGIRNKELRKLFIRAILKTANGELIKYMTKQYPKYSVYAAMA